MASDRDLRLRKGRSTVTETGSEKNDASPRTLAEKIDWLITYKWPPGVWCHSTSGAGISRALAEATSVSLDRSTVWKLRTGQDTNPKLKTLKALTAFFGLPTIGYFDDAEDAGLLNELTVLLTLLENKGVGEDTLRSLAELSPDGRALIIDLIRSIARREKRS